MKNLRFLKVFCYSGVVVMACWGVLGTVLNMFALRSHFLHHLGAKLRHVGAKMAAKSAKMSQHRRKSAPRSLR